MKTIDILIQFNDRRVNVQERIKESKDIYYHFQFHSAIGFADLLSSSLCGSDRLGFGEENIDLYR